MQPAQRHRFVVGQRFLIAVGFIRRGQHDLLHSRAAPACLEHRPCPADIGLERRHRVTVGDRDDRLRREVNNGIDLIFAQDTLHQRLIADIAAHDPDLLDQLRAHQLRLGHPVANQADDIGARLDKAAHQPAAHQASRACDKRRSILPKVAHSHTFQGARCSCQRCSSSRLSRKVSIHCQKLLWR